MGKRARSLAPGRRVLRARARGLARRRLGVARARARRAISRGRARSVARRRRARHAVPGADALGHARAPEDRPHRVPVAGAALHRSCCRVLLRARGGSARVRRGAGRNAVRHRRTSRTDTTASAAASTRSSASRTCRRCGASPARARSCAAPTPGRLGLVAAGGRAARHVAGPVGAVCRRPRDAARAACMMYDALYLWCRAGSSARGADTRIRAARRGPRRFATGCGSASSASAGRPARSR